jgi:hypothetical protein
MIVIRMNVKVAFEIIAPEPSDICMNERTSGVVVFISGLRIFVKIYAGNDMNACLPQTASHSASATEKIYGFKLSGRYVLLNNMFVSLLWHTSIIYLK